MEVWKIIFLFNRGDFRFQVNFPGCTSRPSEKKGKAAAAGPFRLGVLKLHKNKARTYTRVSDATCDSHMLSNMGGLK